MQPTCAEETYNSCAYIAVILGNGYLHLMIGKLKCGNVKSILGHIDVYLRVTAVLHCSLYDHNLLTDDILNRELNVGYKSSL